MAKNIASKTYELMAALSVHQRKRLIAWISGDTGDAGHPVCKAAQYVSKTIAMGEAQPDAARMQQIMFGSLATTPAAEQRMRASLSLLNQYIEDFLVLERVRSMPALRKIILIEAQTELKLGHLNTQHLQQLSSSLSQPGKLAPEHFQWIAKAALLQRSHNISGQKGIKSVSPNEIMELSLKSFLIDIVRKNVGLFQSEDNYNLCMFNFSLVKEFVKFYQFEDSDINFMILFYDFFVKNSKNPKYEDIIYFLSKIVENKNNIPIDIIGDAFVALANLTTRFAFNHGTKEARELLWHIQFQGLIHGLLAPYGNYLAPNKFRLFVNSAVWSGMVSRSELMKIVQSDMMKKILPNMRGKEELILCEAYYDILEHQYDKVIKKLDKARLKIDFYRAESKVLIIKAMYESIYSHSPSNKYEPEAVLIKSAYASRVIREYEDLADLHRDWFHTELNLLGSLVRARSHYDLQRLQKRLERSAMAGFSRFWFEEKIQQRLAKRST